MQQTKISKVLPLSIFFILQRNIEKNINSNLGINVYLDKHVLTNGEFLPLASVIHCHQSSWVLQESQTSDSALWWPSNDTFKVKKGKVKTINSSMRLWKLQHERGIHLKVFNESTAPLRSPSCTFRRRECRHGWISNHALGTCGQFNLQAL